MTLPIRPRPVQVPAQPFEFCASPYVGKDLWEDGLDMFHNWMAQNFKIGAVFPDYMVAESLDVHRAISDIWLCALWTTGRARTAVIARGRELMTNAFILELPATSQKIDITIPQELIDFDPWEDRSLDEEVPDCMYADQYIDKFFIHHMNEYFYYTGKMRRRSRGRTFCPADFAEHPRNVATHDPKTHRDKNAPAPIEWREILDRLCSV